MLTNVSTAGHESHIQHQTFCRDDFMVRKKTKKLPPER